MNRALNLRRALPSLAALHALGLVNDENRPGGRDDVDGAAAPEAVRPLVDDPLVPARVERLHVDNHDLNGAVGGEAVHLGEAVGVVDEKPQRLPVLPAKSPGSSAGNGRRPPGRPPTEPR